MNGSNNFAFGLAGVKRKFKHLDDSKPPNLDKHFARFDDAGQSGFFEKRICELMADGISRM